MKRIKVPNMTFGGEPDDRELAQLVNAQSREYLKWDIAEALKSIPIFTPRQKYALENPIHDPETGELMGVHTGSPGHRDVETIPNPEKFEPEVTVSNFFSGDLKHMSRERKRYQLSTILTVDLEERPVWHMSVAWAYGPKNDMYLVRGEGPASWQPWMHREALRRVRNLIPNVDQRPRLYTDVSRTGKAWHLRAHLDEHELGALKSMRADIVVPVLTLH